MNSFQILVEKLIEKKYEISCAESCTGGLFASSIIDINNASKVIKESFITYSNEAKAKYLNVSPATILKYGVVSEAVALEMVRGLYQLNQANVCVSITGVAGPDSDHLDVGTICFGILINGLEWSKTVKFGNLGRNNVRINSVNYLCKAVCELL